MYMDLPYTIFGFVTISWPGSRVIQLEPTTGVPYRSVSLKALKTLSLFAKFRMIT